MSAYNLTYKPYGSRAILVEWPSKIDKNILRDVILFKNKILRDRGEVILEVINTYNSLTIIYHTTIKKIYNEFSALKSIYKASFDNISVKKYRWKIPVCYDVKFGIDLTEMAAEIELKKEEIIALHSTAVYTVFFIGFLPGFLYLGGLDKRLFFARKSTPRLTVEKGSVGIAGMQTGVYPSQSSGGWNIIGRTPVSFFNPQAEVPCFAKPGDEIQFSGISLATYEQLKTQVDIGFYKPQKIAIDD